MQTHLRWLGVVLCGAFAACSGDDSSLDPSLQPRSVLLTNLQVGPAGEGYRLSDGAVLPGTQSADFYVNTSRVLALLSAVPASFCAKGKLATLEGISTSQTQCGLSGQSGWTGFFGLNGSGNHTEQQSSSIGQSLLVRDAAHQALYRLRITGTSYQQGVSTVRFDVARVPSD
jgi:hypothetical protein